MLDLGAITAERATAIAPSSATGGFAVRDRLARRRPAWERNARRPASVIGTAGCYFVNRSGNWSITPALSMSAISTMCVSAVP